jgi:hypothetical protein
LIAKNDNRAFKGAEHRNMQASHSPEKTGQARRNVCSISGQEGIWRCSAPEYEMELPVLFGQDTGR